MELIWAEVTRLPRVWALVDGEMAGVLSGEAYGSPGSKGESDPGAGAGADILAGVPAEQTGTGDASGSTDDDKGKEGEQEPARPGPSGR